MEEFLKSKPILTPTVAGASVTVLTGTLVGEFGLPGNWTGLCLSAILALFVWGDKSVSLPSRFLFYILNAVTIFAVASGLNGAGASALGATKTCVERGLNDPSADLSLETTDRSTPFFRRWDW